MAWFYEFGKTFDDLEKHLSPLFPEEFPGGGLIKAGGRSRLNGKEEVVVLGVCWAGQGQLQLWKVLKLKGRKFIHKFIKWPVLLQAIAKLSLPGTEVTALPDKKNQICQI
jgi:hypothetical protein